jgi:hypothetical protein
MNRLHVVTARVAGGAAGALPAGSAAPVAARTPVAARSWTSSRHSKQGLARVVSSSQSKGLFMSSAACRQLPHASHPSRAFSATATEDAKKQIEVTIEKVTKEHKEQVQRDNLLVDGKRLCASLYLAVPVCKPPVDALIAGT